jgi:hypothetical protein
MFETGALAFFLHIPSRECWQAEKKNTCSTRMSPAGSADKVQISIRMTGRAVTMVGRSRYDHI